MTEPASGGSTEYINHHLHFWQVSVGDGAFMKLNVDTLIFTAVLSLLFVFFFVRSARKSTAGVPGKFQTVVEIVVTFVDGLVRETFHGRSKLIAPLAITTLAAGRNLFKYVEPPAPKVTEKYLGCSSASLARVTRSFSAPSGVFGGKNSMLNIFCVMFFIQQERRQGP